MIPLRGLNGRAAFVALVCVATLHASLYPAIYANDFSNLSLFLYAIPAAVAGGLAFVRARQSTGHDRLGWAILAAVLIATMVLDCIWSLTYRAEGELPYPNWLDLPYVLSYPCYMAGVGLLASPLWRGRDRRWVFDAAALLSVSAGLLWHFVLPETSDGALTETLLGGVYLLLDLAFFGTVLSGLYLGQPSLRNMLLLLAATTLATGDVLFYFHPIAFDSTWTIGFWLFAIAAVTPPALMMRFPQRRPARAEVIPYAFVGAIAVVTLVEMRRGDADDLLLSGVVALGLVVARQIITLRRALQRQRQETAFREAVLETQSDLGLGMLILQDNRVVFANGAAERMTGVPASMLMSMPSVDRLAFPSQREEWLAWLADPAYPEDTRFARPDGSVVDIEVVARWLNAPGEPRLLLVARDVTARKQADLALAQAQKLEGLGALAGGVAHDFNNLLSSVIGNASLLKMGELDDEALESVEGIDAAARRGAELTRSLLDFARAQPQQFRQEDLRHCLAETAALARKALPVNVALHLDTGDIPAPVRGDHGQLVQAFLNLIINARDAVGDCGQITVRLHLEHGNANVDVTDTGHGMDEATRDRIFEPFFTTKTAGAGTGLGLAISQRTIRDHRGQLTVRSAPGEGSTFTVSLPLAAIARAG